MKKIVLILTNALFFAGITLIGCNTSSEKKVENARENVNEAKQDLKEAQNDYAREWEEFKNEQSVRIANNEKEIADYRVRIQKDKAAVREKREKKLVALERENSELKVRLEGYKDDGHNNWQQFKSEFKQSMDHLGQGFKELFDNDKD